MPSDPATYLMAVNTGTEILLLRRETPCFPARLIGQITDGGDGALTFSCDDAELAEAVQDCWEADFSAGESIALVRHVYACLSTSRASMEAMGMDPRGAWTRSVEANLDRLGIAS